jgi:hypothetical protein
MKIQSEFPELSKYIAEMPQNFSGKNHKNISTSKLNEYYQSLQGIVLEYAKTHKKEEMKK